VLVGVLVFQVAIGVASEASLRIWTPEASSGEPIASRPSDWQAAPMLVAPIGTGGTDPTPPARYGHAMAYDSQSDRLVLFGGGSSSGGVFVLVSDTWAYDFNTSTWTDMSPAIEPPARYNHAMAYDSQADRVILFGGYGGYNDTWAYDFNTNTWTDTNPVVEPPGRWGHALAYDSQSDRVILFGGSLYDTWAYDFNTNIWTDMAP